MILILLSCLMLCSANVLLSLACLWTLPILVLLTWRRSEPCILPYVVFFQWLQISLKVFRYDFYNAPLENVGFSGGACEITTAIWLMLLGLVVLVLGILTGKGTSRKGVIKDESIGKSNTIKTYFLWYLFLTIGTLWFSSRTFVVLGISQFLVVVFRLKWVVLFCYVYLSIEKGRARDKYLLGACILFEMIIGFLGYFSTFKMVFIIIAIAYLSVVGPVVKARTVAIVALLMIFVLMLGLIWTSIKSEYRITLNQGWSGQVVTISNMDRFKVLSELVGQLGISDLIDAGGSICRRIEEVDFMGYTLLNVPSIVPHENGKLFLKAIMHVLRPRLLFPNKEVLDDSADTKLYSGVHVAGSDEGVSIGIGYMAYAYVDFGILGMYISIYLLGLLAGRIYSFFCYSIPNKLFGQGCCVVVLMGITQTETSFFKVFGGLVSSFLVLSVLCYSIRHFSNKYALARREITH